MRTDNQDARGKRENRSGLDEGAEIVARRQQQPDRQGRRREAIGNDGEGERHTTQGEHARPRGRVGHPLPCDDREKNERDPHNRSFQDPAGPDEAKIQS